MAKSTYLTLGASTCAFALFAFGSSAYAQSAATVDCSKQACPDLVINLEDSFAFDPDSPPSCRARDALATGYVAIKNVGTRSAVLGNTSAAAATATILGVAGQSSWLAIYNPYNPDMRTENITDGVTGADRNLFSTDRLDPYDQKGFRYAFARDTRKDLRAYSSPETRGNISGNRSRRDEVRLVQAALNADSRLDVNIAEDGIYGSETSGAVAKYQQLIGEPVTGTLTRNQRDRLFQFTYSSVGARGKVCVDIYAFVDPNNRIAESNEANNIAAWRVEIDCSPNAGSSNVTVTPSSAPGFTACGNTYYGGGFGGYRLPRRFR